MTTIKVPLYGFLNSKRKRLLNLVKIVKERRLNISNLEEVGSSVIGIDTKKRILLYSKNAPDASSCLIIDLANLQECIISKQYKGINAGDLYKRKMSDFLKSIFLKLRFRDNATPVTLQMFEAQNGRRNDIERIEEKVKKWETIVLSVSPAGELERA